MPQLNHKGPDGNGPKTGRKLGACKKKESEKALNEIGVGQGLKRKSGGETGNKKRLQYNKKV